MVHHWIGTVLIPGVTLDRTIGLVQDYERYPDVYAPDVRASAIRSREGDRFEVYLRLYTKKVLTWVADTEHSVEFVPVGDTRMHVPSRSTRILEIEHPDTPRERAKPEGDDRGFAWRLNNYCSFEERDEGHPHAVRVDHPHPGHPVPPRRPSGRSSPACPARS